VRPIKSIVGSQIFMTTYCSLYIHIPFCVKRCAYCDFNTYAGQDSLLPDYIDALCKEMLMIAESQDKGLNVQTIYFGGGTPSLVSFQQYEKLFRAISENFNLINPEISLEANPGTLSLEYLKGLHSLGFNRISLGVQSSHPEELHFLERIHDFYDVINAIEWIHRSSFTNYNLDLLFGLPGQTLERWKETLSLLPGLNPTHLSLYSLTIERNTVLGRWARKGLIPVPDADLSADMFEQAMEFLPALGYEQYEISNWSRLGFECRHNLQYWRNLPYLGIGAGAHGYAFSLRYSNSLHIKTYIDRVKAAQADRDGYSTQGITKKTGQEYFPAKVHQERISRRVEMQETMMVGLRLTKEGVSTSVFQNRFGVGLEEIFGKEIEKLLQQGLLEWKNDHGTSQLGVEVEDEINREKRLVLTPRGRMVGNQVFQYFVGE
jgi:oxygen-independent coproporphyrinogen III oxidase